MRIPVYKLASKDGKGAWFARRSVHQGLPFERWKEKLKGEFEETRRIRKRNGGSLEGGSIRGIGCERVLEKIDVPGETVIDERGGKESGQLGLMEVYHLSASFPGPSTPRDFVTLLITSDKALDGEGYGGSESQKTYIVISKPCKHPDAPPRKGFIRGQYESIEFIRELPDDADDGLSSDSCSETGNKIKPVEWVMITRSDPGGSIPRWMVEKGTTPSIVDDARKFVEWANRDDQEDSQGPISNVSRSSSGSGTRPIRSSDRDTGKQRETGGDGPHIANLIDGVVGLVSLGLDTVTPQMVHNYLDRHGYSLHGSASHGKTYAKAKQNEACTCTCHSESQISLYSEATPTGTSTPSSEVIPNQHSRPQGRRRATSTNSEAHSVALSTSSAEQAAAVPSSKESAKLAKKRENIEDKLEALHDEQRALRRGDEKAANASAASHNGEDGSQLPTPSRTGSSDVNGTIHPPSPKVIFRPTASQLKRLSNLEHKEAKLISQISKIESQQEKAVAQAEAKQRKEAQKNERKNARAELEGLKEEARRLKGEVKELRGERQQWVELVGRLQKENTRLAAEVQGGELEKKI